MTGKRNRVLKHVSLIMMFAMVYQPIAFAQNQNQSGPTAQERALQKRMVDIRKAYKSKDFKKAAQETHKLLPMLSQRDQVNRFRIIKGLALYNLGLKVAALETFLAVGRNSPSQKDLKSVLVNAVAAARTLHTEDKLIQIYTANKNTPIPNSVRENLNYRLGKAYMRLREPKVALPYLQQVGKSSVRYLDSRLLEGIAWNQLRDRDRAYRVFRDILSTGVATQDDQVVWELANLNAARVAFAGKQHQVAVDHYSRVPRSSTFWLDALFESSWPLYHMDDYNLALGALQTLHSPYFVNKFFPEGLILRAVTLFRLCKYGEMRNTVNFYRKEYTPNLKLLDGYLKDRGASKRAYFEDMIEFINETNIKAGGISSRVWDWVASDPAFGELRDRWKILQNEKKTAIKLSFSTPTLRAEVERTNQSYVNQLAGEINEFVKSKLIKALNILKNMEDQIAVLEFEQTLGEKQAIEQLKSPHSETDVSISVNVRDGFDLWPFTGEYWKDELGFYAYSTGDSCKEDLQPQQQVQ